MGGRERVIRFLTTAAIIGIGVWIITQVVSLISFFGIIRTVSQSFANWIAWVQILSQLAYDVWVGALALLLLLWLTERLAGSTLPPESPPPPDPS